jgi:hypothetical protein
MTTKDYNNDPFAKYGGTEVKVADDPFKKYGGKSVVEPVKKKEVTPALSIPSSEDGLPAVGEIPKEKVLDNVFKMGYTSFSPLPAGESESDKSERTKKDDINNFSYKVYTGDVNPDDLYEFAKKPYGNQIVRNLLTKYSSDVPVADGDIMNKGPQWSKAAERINAENRKNGVSLVETAVKNLDTDIENIVSSFRATRNQNGLVNWDLPKINPDDPTTYNKLLSAVEKSYGLVDADGKYKPGEKEKLVKALNSKLLYLKSKEPIAPEIEALSDKIQSAVLSINNSRESGEDNKPSIKYDEDNRNHFMAGLNFIKDSNPAKYANIVRSLNGKGKIADTDFEHLSELGQQIVNQSFYMGAATDPSLLDKETNLPYIGTTKQSKKADAALKIGEWLKSNGYTNYREYPASLIKKASQAVGGISPDIERTLIAEEGILGYDAIPKSGGVEAFVRGIQTPLAGIKNTFENITGDAAGNYLRTQQYDVGTGQKVVDKKGRAGAELPSDRGNVWYDALEGFGQFIPQVLLTRGIGAPIAATAEAAVASIAPRAALTAGQASNIVNYGGTFISTYLQEYGNAYEEGLNKTGDPATAKAMGAINGITAAGFELLLPDTKIADRAANLFRKGGYSESIIDLLKKGGDPEYLAKKGRGIIQKFVTNTLDIARQEVSEEIGTNVVNYITESIFSPSTAAQRDLGTELLETAQATAVSMIIPSILGGGGAAVNKDFTRSGFDAAALNLDDFKKSLGRALIEDNISQQDHDKAISLLQTHSNSIQNAPEQNVNGRALSTRQQVDFAFQNTRIKVLEQQLENADGAVAKEAVQKKIAEAEEIQRKILMPEGTAASMPVLEEEGVERVSELSTEGKVNDAADFIEELKSGELINDVEYSVAKDNPLQYFQTVAQQANNIRSDNTFDTETDERQSATDRYGDTIIDYANELFPQYAEIAKASSTNVITVGPNEISQPIELLPIDTTGRKVTTVAPDQISEPIELSTELPADFVPPAAPIVDTEVNIPTLPAAPITQESTVSPVEKSTVDEYFKGRIASFDIPPAAAGRQVSTLSGLTEKERQQRVEERKTETKLTKKDASANAILQKVNEYNKLPNGRMGKLKPAGLQLLNSIRNDASAAGYVFDERSGRLKNKKGKIIRGNNAEGGDRSIKEGAKVLRERSDELNNAFGQILDAGIFPNGYSLSGNRMSDAQIEGAVQDIVDGIPSERASNYLDQLEGYVANDRFEIGGKDNQKVGVPLAALLGTSQETVGEPLTEQAVMDWLNESGTLAPEVEEIFEENLEQLIENNSYNEQETTTSEVQPVIAGGKEQGGEITQPDNKDKGGRQEPKVKPQPTAQDIARELNELLGNGPLALNVDPSERVSFNDIGITVNDTPAQVIDKLISYAPEMAPMLEAIKSDPNFNNIRLELSDSRRLENGELGLYYPSGNAQAGLMQISNGGNVAYTLAHELSHFYTLDSQRANEVTGSESYKALEDLYNFISSQKGKPVPGLQSLENYGLTNFKEFMAELFSNPTFRNAVSDVFAQNREEINKISSRIRNSKSTGIADLIFNFFKELFSKITGRSNNKAVEIDANIPVIENAARIATELFFGGNPVDSSQPGVVVDMGSQSAAALALPSSDNMDKIKEYVRKRLSQGVSPEVIKDGLELIGLDKKAAVDLVNDIVTPIANKSTRTKAEEDIIISTAMARAIDEKQFPTIFENNRTAEQLAAETQGLGQGRQVDGAYVVALQDDLKEVSLQTANFLRNELGADWGLKTLSWLEKNPSQGNIAQTIGILNVISTENFQEINKEVDGLRLNRLRSIQNRIDIVSNGRARAASLGLRQRILYTKFAQGEDVNGALAQMILSPEMVDLQGSLSEILAQPVSEQEINDSPRLKTKPVVRSRGAVKKSSSKETVSALVNRAAEVSKQVDEETGKVVNKSFNDFLNDAKNKLGKLDC